MSEITIGTFVAANRDLPNRNVKKGDRGIVLDIQNIDSDLYLYLEMKDGSRIGPSCDNYWDFSRPTSLVSTNIAVQKESMPEFTNHKIIDSDVEITTDDNGVLSVSFSYWAACSDAKTICEFVDAVNADKDDDMLVISSPLTGILDFSIEININDNSPEGVVEMYESSKPKFDAIKNDLLALIAKIDVIKFVSNKEE